MTVLGSDDPVRVFQDFATLDLIFGHDRFLVQLTVGPMEHDKVLRAIELLGTEVAPRVRAELGPAHGLR